MRIISLNVHAQLIAIRQSGIEALVVLSDLTTLREEAQEALENERYEDALALYERISQAAPTAQDALARTADILVRLRRGEEALIAIEKALAACDDDSTAAWLLRMKAHALWEGKRYDAAQEVVEAALRLEPDDIYALLTKCYIERDLGHPEASLAAAQRAAELEPEVYQTALDYAGALYRLKRYEEAIPIYERASELNSRAAAPPYWKGRALSALERHEDALAMYEATVTLSPDFADGWRWFAGVLALKGRYDEALKACDHALKLNDNAEFWELKAKILQQTGRLEDAIFALNEFIARRPDDAKPILEKSFLIYQLKRYHASVSMLDKGLSQFPNDIELMKLRGSALRLLERYKDALATWKRVLELDPDEAMTLRNVLEIYLWQKRYGDMLLPTNRLLARNERDGAAWAQRIEALYRLGQFEEAQAAGIEASRLSPDDANVKTWAKIADQAFHRPGRDGHITLRDGRRMEYAEYGAPDGRPILCCHGTPGSRFEYWIEDSTAQAFGLRLIAPDRPGYGLSDPNDKASFLAWVDDAAELADALGLRQFAVLGVSGGGAYAAACAYKFPARVTSLTLISSPAPVALRRLWHNLGWQSRIASISQHAIPWPLRKAMGRISNDTMRDNPEMTLRLHDIIINGMKKNQRPRIYTPVELATAAEPFRRNHLGHMWDSRLASRPWGFDVKDIAAPTYVWHGEKDRQAPLIAGQYFAQNIPNCHATFYAEEGHWVFSKHQREIFDAIVKAAKEHAPEAAEMAMAKTKSEA